MSNTPTKRIVILGGGFAGVSAAKELEKQLARHPKVQITLVSRENFFLFTPMLHEVATSDLELTTIVNPVRKILTRTQVFVGEIKSIDLSRREVTVSHGFDHHEHSLVWDHLVIGLGSRTNVYELPGLEERALTIKSLGDAVRLRNHLIAQLEEADSECVTKKDPLLTFVVAGGGFAGVETVAGINDFVREVLPSYPHLRKEMLRVVLVHAGAIILPELGDKLGVYAQKKLAARGVEIHLNAKATSLSERSIELSDGTSIESNTLVWAAGTSPYPLVRDLPCKKERGRIVVNPFLEVVGWPGVWAIGDCAAVPDASTGRASPPTAQHALRQGKIVGHNIAADVRSKAKQPFVFATLGQLATIGTRSAVANILGVHFSGFVAWWFWRTIYLSKLPRVEKKVRVALDWSLDLLFSKDIVQFSMESAPALTESSDEVSNSRARHHAEPRSADVNGVRQM
ncbi:MAG TPA: NAD(P)/FAD-dependent oxidoreductase [Terriglobales bacterium]|nr:NAD(P)/FAD-dependent oxidoreductase [Terriglobales bacterium]